jgi:hypothetical protein
MSKQQTAVEWLRQNIENTFIDWGSEFYYNQKGESFNYLVIRIQPEKLDEFFHQAKQMEKEQIQKAYDDSVWQYDDDISSEQYCNGSWISTDVC